MYLEYFIFNVYIYKVEIMVLKIIKIILSIIEILVCLKACLYCFEFALKISMDYNDTETHCAFKFPKKSDLIRLTNSWKLASVCR